MGDKSPKKEVGKAGDDLGPAPEEELDPHSSGMAGGSGHVSGRGLRLTCRLSRVGRAGGRFGWYQTELLVEPRPRGVWEPQATHSAGSPL